MTVITYTFMLPLLILIQPLRFGAVMDNIQAAGDWLNYNALVKSYIRGSDVITSSGYDWSIPDTKFGGVHVNWITVQNAPAWMTNGMICDLPLPEYRKEYGDFVIAVIERYHPEYVELGNEQDAYHRDEDLAWYFGCSGAGDWYGEFVDKIYEYVKPYAGDTKIIMGALMDAYNYDFVYEMFDETEHGTFDGVSYHCYEYFADNLSNTCQAKRDYLSTWTEKPIYLSETAVICQGCNIADYENYAQVEHFKRVSEFDTISILFMANYNGWPVDVIGCYKANCDMVGKNICTGKLYPRPVHFLYMKQ